MRVIAGKARRIQLKTIKGLHTRPTTDRIKETLFNMIQPYLFDANFLDLFSGSGGIGIEALSRGAKHAWFVDNYKQSISCIQDNLKVTNMIEQADVLGSDVKTALDILNKKQIHMDIIFMDPPYNNELEKDVLIFLSKSDLIDKDSIIIVEASLETSMDYCDEIGFEIIREKKYKTNKHYFIKQKEK